LAGEGIVAMALTWDGARWPSRTLPAKARAFLGGQGRRMPSTRKMADLLAEGKIAELRICWVPRLKGGEEVLSLPFAASDGLRIPFRPIKTIRFGEILGVIYRRTKR
jgi:hypothetical protein